MKPLETLLAHRRTIRVMGFDDAPFEKRPGAPVDVAGVVCADTRFEGMVWGTATRDGDDATRVMAALLTGSKAPSGNDSGCGRDLDPHSPLSSSPGLRAARLDPGLRPVGSWAWPPRRTSGATASPAVGALATGGRPHALAVRVISFRSLSSPIRCTSC